MKITKYEHACLVIENNDKVLVLDPGILAKLPDIANIAAIFITHIHGDHLNIENLESLMKLNPNLTLIGSDEVLDKVSHLTNNTKIANPGDIIKVEDFEIKIDGKDHAVVYKTSPCLNRTVTVNGKFYYPGDSFDLPTDNVELVAVPASAPWLKSSEYMDFIKEIKVSKIFPTHNGLLSEFGEDTVYNWMSVAAEEVGTELIILRPGESVEV